MAGIAAPVPPAPVPEASAPPTRGARGQAVESIQYRPTSRWEKGVTTFAPGVKITITVVVVLVVLALILMCVSLVGPLGLTFSVLFIPLAVFILLFIWKKDEIA